MAEGKRAPAIAAKEKRPVGRPRKVEATPTGPNFSSKEQAFLHAYYDANSPTKGQGKESAITAGFTDYRIYTKVINKYDSVVMAGALEAVGLPKLTLALRLKRIIDDADADAKDVLAATKLMLSIMGERTETGNSVNVNVASPKSLVMIGFENEGLSNMLKGKKPAQLKESNEGQASVVEGELVSTDSETGA